MISSCLSHDVFEESPPILLDIGASGDTYSYWNALMPFSHCIAFEADDRESSSLDAANDSWKKLTVVRALATSESVDNLNFNLTQFPYCSSTLDPDSEALSEWDFASLFKLDGRVSMKAVNLSSALAEAGVDRIDWFKTDSQGIDLRLFASLKDAIRRKIIVADFEPGIIDAYVGEDKLHHLMAYMEHEPFWIHSMNIKGPKRILKEDIPAQADCINSLMRKQKPSPGWCEISYFNSMRSESPELRELLLGCIFATLLEQHGFVLRIARRAKNFFEEEVFDEFINHSASQLL